VVGAVARRARSACERWRAIWRSTAANTGIRFTVPDAEAEHTAMRERGVDVGDVTRWDGVPPMYTFDDPDGNRFYVVGDSA